jgi:hypothetical protein
MKPQTITFNPISTLPPELDYPGLAEILIYDASLNDTVIGYFSPGRHIPYGWYDCQTNEQLPHPTHWAEKPYPKWE